MKKTYLPELTLREVCLKYGVSRRAVQGYEKHGLAGPTGKTERGYLLYDEAAQKRICLIKKLQDFGFAVGEIGGYFGASVTAKKKMLEEKKKALGERLRKLEEALIEIEKTINEL